MNSISQSNTPQEKKIDTFNQQSDFMNRKIKLYYINTKI